MEIGFNVLGLDAFVDAVECIKKIYKHPDTPESVKKIIENDVRSIVMELAVD